MTDDEIFNMPFSIERHKQSRWLNLEVIISPDGEVCYARPSHQEFLIQKACEINKCTRDELYALCPQEYWGDFLTWLFTMTGGYIPVWEDGVIDILCTKKQYAALKTLKLNGLYKGALPRWKNEEAK